MKVFLDTNIFLDYFQERLEGGRHAHQILRSAELNQIECCTTAISISNIMYVLKKSGFMADEIRRTLTELIGFVEIIQTLNEEFVQAFHSRFADLEDALQYFSALSHGSIDYFITQNKKHFKAANEMLPVFTAGEFLKINLT